jgi:hypothetical protein
MEQEKKQKQNYDEVGKVVLDFDKLTRWRNKDKDDLPICSCLSLYKASGLEDIIKKYSQEHNGFQVIGLDHLYCNFDTLDKIKEFITKNWQKFSIDIDQDNHVYWDTKKWAKGQEHYLKTLKPKIKTSVLKDFYDYCPGIDEEVEDNIIIFRIYHLEDESKKKKEN